MFTFLKMMYSQNDKIGVFTGSKNQTSLHSPFMMGRLLENFYNFFLWFLHIASSISARLSKKKFNISPNTVTRISKYLDISPSQK